MGTEKKFLRFDEQSPDEFYLSSEEDIFNSVDFIFEDDEDVDVSIMDIVERIEALRTCEYMVVKIGEYVVAHMKDKSPIDGMLTDVVDSEELEIDGNRIRLSDVSYFEV